MKKITMQIKNLVKMLEGWFLWLAPLTIFLVALVAPSYLFKFDYLKFVEAIIWPFTTLTALFFFKKVFTYMFFSMDEFSFFGLKGHLRNVNEVIIEEVNRKFLEKINEEKRKDETEKLNLEIKSKESEINKAKGSAEENLELAREIMKEWKESIKKNAKTILSLEAENRRLGEIVSRLPTPYTVVESSIPVIDDAKTSDPISEESTDNI